MEKIYHLDILSPDKIIYSGDVVSLIAPGEEGYLGVLAHHAPLISNLVPGKITFKDTLGKTTELNCGSAGFLDVDKDQVTLLLNETVQ